MAIEKSMNLNMWECIREYIAAEIELALLGNRPNHNRAPKSEIEMLEQQSTRMDTAIREMITDETAWRLKNP